MTVDVINRSKGSLPIKFYKVWVKHVVDQLIKKNIRKDRLEVEHLEMAIVFMEKEDAQKLNLQYRQKDYATDVLSFESFDRTSLGELVLCQSVVMEQAKEHKLSFKEESAYLILHGILHLLGYDHEKGPEEEKEMFDLQDEIFETIDQVNG